MIDLFMHQVKGIRKRRQKSKERKFNFLDKQSGTQKAYQDRAIGQRNQGIGKNCAVKIKLFRADKIRYQ